MIPTIPFEAFPKIARMNRDCLVTEKIDGTNGTIYITDSAQVFAGSKNQWITPEQDNHGFAKWVAEHQGELLGLGPGMHRGEWYGAGVNKNRHKIPDKRFALFNTKFTTDPAFAVRKPDCCGVVPLLYTGMFNSVTINELVEDLRKNGSRLHPGSPAEGLIVFHLGASIGFKVTCEKDSEPKGLSGA